jgi:hypothetical protein
MSLPIHTARGDRGAELDVEKGYVIALTALLLLPILAFTSFAVDLGAWYARASEIQRASDAAALAGAPLLPNMGLATDAARTTLAKNGFVAGDDISISYTKVNNTRMQVRVTDASVPQYFSSLFRDTVSIERQATAEKIKPVPMGSPRNFLGTNQELASYTSNARENFWISVSGYCAKNEHGDRITPRADRNGNHSCVPGTGGALANDDYSADGYYYAVEFPDDYAGGSATLQAFDAAHCQGNGSGADDSGANTGSARQYDFIVRSNDSNDPAMTTVLQTTRISPSNCTTYRDQWRSLWTFGSPTPGTTYYLQVKPVIPTDQTGSDSIEGQNQFGLRLQIGGTFSPCTTDATTAASGIPASATSCANVYALTHLGVYANLAGSTPSFYLASVGEEHAGKVMEVELFDSAEGAEYIELLDPNGDPATFTWEIGCKDGTYRSENGGSCTTGEQAPTNGYGPGTTNKKSVAGDGTRPWSSGLTQSGIYSDRLLRLRVNLPATYGDIYGANTWWRIRYTKGPAAGDRTTWTIRIKGDPVRLVPNS